MAQDEESISLDEAREFFKIAEVRREESGMFVLDSRSPDSGDQTGGTSGAGEEEYEEEFSPEEAKRLLWENEEMKQPVVGYQIIAKLGTGGSATVFKARDMTFDREVALKLLYPALAEDRKSLKTFVREGMTLIRLKHPNILEGYDFGFSKGFYFQVLEFIEGIAVSQFLDKGKRVREPEAVRIVAQVARAIGHLEERSIVHRDIKPSNILIVRKKGVKLCDFGLCLDRGKTLNQKPDQLETTVGTPEYMAPEQAMGRTDLDVRTDIYSLGVSLFHMVSGRLPFEGDSSNAIFEQHIQAGLDFEGLDEYFSNPLKMLILKMMAKDRDARHPDAESLLHDIDVLYGHRP